MLTIDKCVTTLVLNLFIETECNSRCVTKNRLGAFEMGADEFQADIYIYF